MRMFGLILLTCCFVVTTNGQPSLPLLRASFTQATKDKAAFMAFSQCIRQINTAEQSPLIKGYQSIAYFLQCRYVINPYEKWKNYLKGSNLMEAAVNHAPADVELRWLRYAVQTQLPFFLNYHQHEQEDRRMLLKYLQTSPVNDPDLYQRIDQFIQKTAP